MKPWVIAALVLVLLGIIICLAGLCMIDFDFSKLNREETVTKTYTPDIPFQNIAIDTDISHISIFPSDDDTCRVVVRESSKCPHDVQVADGTMSVKQQNHRKWYDYIGFFWPTSRIEIYLPQADYADLTVNTQTGNTQIGDGLSFKSVAVRTSTGSVTVSDAAVATIAVHCSTGKVTLKNLTVSDELNVTVSTGDLSVSDSTAHALQIKCNTGDLKLTNTLVSSLLQAETTTGDITLNRCDADSIRLKTDTGDIEGTLLSPKIMFAESETGKICVPRSTTGGSCDITTDTGNITISFS